MTDETHSRDGLLANWSTDQLNRGLAVGISGVFFLALAVAPFALSSLDILKLTAALFFVMFVISWDFVSGYTGLVSFGHTLFFALGGYTTAILNLEYGIDPLLGIVAGILVAAVGGLVYGLPARRIEGHYLALLTLLPPLILLRVLQLYPEFTGGETGLPRVEFLLQGSSFARNAFLHYYVAFALFVVIFALAWVVTRSDTGTIFTAIKENEDAVASVGINPDKYKVYAYVMSAAMGGLAGAVFVHTPAGGATPSQLLALIVMIEILLASILGGFGTITGAVIGGMTIYWFREWLRGIDWNIPLSSVQVGDIDMIIFLLVLLALLMFMADGIVPWAKSRGSALIRVLRSDRSLRDAGEAWIRNGVSTTVTIIRRKGQ